MTNGGSASVSQYDVGDDGALVAKATATVPAGSGPFGVAVRPTPATTAPVASSDAYSTDEDTPLTVNAGSGVLGNDSDADNNALTAVKVSDPSLGSVTLNQNGSFVYAPAADYTGPDSFTYKANDGSSDSNTATVSITVNAVNDAPTVAVGGRRRVRRR